MFEYKGKKYDFKFTKEKVSEIETATGKSLIAEWQEQRGLLRLTTLDVIFQLCIKPATGSDFLNQQDGLDTGNGLMNEHGYGPVCMMIINQLKKDVPFLFLVN